MLTNAAVRAARPRPRAYKVSDERGLVLAVAPTGTKSWRLRWRDREGKEQLLTIGSFPTTSLDAARATRDQLRAVIALGLDPRAPANDDEPTFQAVARAWHAHRAPGWSPVHARDVLRSLEADVFPAIGAMPLDQVTRPAVLQLLRAIEARGAIETARRVQQRVELAFGFARAEGWTTADNPADVEAALANGKARGRQPALVDVDELRVLMTAIDALSAAPALKLASRFLALTGVRLAALRGTLWNEVEGLDGPEPLWRVPAARMKLKAVNKSDAERDHLVPLSTAAAAVMREARDHLGAAGNAIGLVFPGRGGAGPIGAGALNELYARAGFAGRHCAHGWRASFSTVMNERRPADRAAIDRALGHIVQGVSEKEGAYNRAQHLPLRREILEDWAGLII